MTDILHACLPCNLCGSREVTALSQRSRSGRAMRSVACTGCGLVWADPRPHAVRHFYEEDYRLAYKGTFTPRPKHVLRAGRVALERFGRIAGRLRAGSRVLDVGSGGGEFAYLLASRGHRVAGVEPNRGYAQHARQTYGLEVREGFIGDVALPAGGYDVITIWHVLEHTEDPAGVLRQLRAALADGGRLVVEVPNVEATCQSPRSSFHEAHLYTFNLQTLQRMGVCAGLQAVDTSVSADGGNITVVFAPAAQEAPAAPDGRMPWNHARVAAAVAGHTPWSHALSAHPWRRFAGRVARMVSEAWALRRGEDGKALLDRLYAVTASPQPAPASAPAARLPRLAAVALLAAYVAAVVAEEVLLDGILPAVQFEPAQGWAAYLGLQLLVMAALFWGFGQRLGSRRALVRAGAWTVPLLAVPAVC